jgi:hypothetical protein
MSPGIARIMKCRRLQRARLVAKIGRQKCTHNFGSKTSWKPRREWEDNIKMDIKEIGHEDERYVEPAEDRV